MAVRFHPGDTLARPDRVELRYWSDGRGFPLVFLHGLAGYGGEWGPFISALDSGIAALTFDQRGHGRSTRRPADVSRQAYVKDVAAVIEEGGPGRPVTLVGQSMGAHTAMLTAAAYPELVEKLVMIEGGVGGGGQPALDQLRASLGRWPSSFADRQSAVSFFGGGLAAEVWVAGLESRGEALFPQFDLDVMVETMRPVFEAPAWAAWQKVRQPTLIVLGDSGSIDRDQIDLMAQSRDPVQVEIVHGAGHDVHLDQPEVLADVLRPFVNH